MIVSAVALGEGKGAFRVRHRGAFRDRRAREGGRRALLELHRRRRCDATIDALPPLRRHRALAVIEHREKVCGARHTLFRVYQTRLCREKDWLC